MTGFRNALGVLAILGGLAGLAGLFAIEIPAGNRDAVTLALGIILGWGSSVVSFEFGSSPSERKAASGPAGTRSDPIATEEVA